MPGLRDESFFEGVIRVAEGEKKRRGRKRDGDEEGKGTFFWRFCVCVGDRGYVGKSEMGDNIIELFCRVVLMTKRFGYNDWKEILSVLKRVYDDSRERVKNAAKIILEKAKQNLKASDPSLLNLSNIIPTPFLTPTISPKP